MKVKYLMVLFLALSLTAYGEIVPTMGFYPNVDYKAMEKQGPWDDRNYMTSKADLKYIPKNDQFLAYVPLFYKIEMRKRNPNMGKYYPRTTHQAFLMEYGGIAADGIWHKEGLGIKYHKGNIVAGLRYKTQERVSYEVSIKATAENEVALATGVSGNEVTIECNPTNKNNCVAGSNQSGGQTMYYSSDAGATWTKSQTNSGSCCDPTVDWSSDGSIVYQGDLSIKGRGRIGVRWSRSLDQGHTWESMHAITTGGSDKEFIHVDRSATSAHLDNIYMTWHDSNVMQFARSTDMGVSFSNPISFGSEPRGIGSDITTDAAGNVYYFYPALDGVSGVRVLKSTDGGATFSSGVKVADLNGDFDFPIPAMETREVFIYVSADKSTDNDTLFVAWTDEADDSVGGGTGSATNNHAVIQVAKSTNGGANWSMCAIPHNTSDSLAAGNTIDRFHPWLKVDELGVVHIAYYDTRHSSNRSGVDFYYTRSVDDCASWDTEMRYSTQTSSNLSDGQEWGDYNGLSVVLDRMAMTWTDNRAGKVAMVGSGSVDGTPPSNSAPTASFTYSCTDLVCNFDGTGSSDSDGSIVNYSWSFGASTATANNVFTSSGTFSVTLSVTDNEGATGSNTQSITVSDGSVSNITLSGTRAGNGRSVTLNWTGAAGANVDIYENGSLKTTTANDGSATLTVRKNRTFTYEVCEQGSTVVCSNSITL